MIRFTVGDLNAKINIKDIFEGEKRLLARKLKMLIILALKFILEVKRKKYNKTFKGCL